MSLKYILLAMLELFPCAQIKVLLRNEAIVEMPKTAVLQMATGGWLQKRVSTHVKCPTLKQK